METQKTRTTISRQKSLRLYLQEVLAHRCAKNPGYSLRAFASSMGIGPAALSEVLKGKRPITAKMKLRLVDALGLTSHQAAKFSCDRDPLKPAVLASYNQLDADTYAVIADWYHYAILELMLVSSFRGDAVWIGKVLGITKSEANIAIERLCRLGLIKVDDQGEWKDTSGGFSTNILEPNRTSTGAKKLQRQLTALSLSALEATPITLRNHTSATVAIDPNVLPEAVRKITAFRRELSQFLAESGSPSEVYNLGIALYPISNTKQGEK